MLHDDIYDNQQPVIAELFEACFVELVQTLAEKNKLKKGGFAQSVWPESTPQVARNRWNAMRTVDHRTGKPTSCTLADAYRMAMALGLQMPYICLQAEAMVGEKLKQMKQEGDLKPQAGATRRKRSKKAGDDQHVGE